jgi:hypothetical protein
VDYGPILGTDQRGPDRSEPIPPPPPIPTKLALDPGPAPHQAGAGPETGQASMDKHSVVDYSANIVSILAKVRPESPYSLMA